MVYGTAAAILIVVNVIALSANLVMLPGNWIMVGALSLFLVATGATTGPDWTTLLIALILAVVGEALETFAGSATASRKGASRRAMILSLVVSIIGSIVGAFVIPIPVIGSAVGAVAGAAAGAFSGAWLGEAWKGTDPSLRKEIGKAAMTGRMVGMLAKLAIGVAIFVVQLASFW
ncbi:MAG: DUF456 domain-containing protein [Planctomycetaceae bacterium]|nr:DUF456 domain-containing protein [Planctomycetaceae bacterium]